MPNKEKLRLGLHFGKGSPDNRRLIFGLLLGKHDDDEGAGVASHPELLLDQEHHAAVPSRTALALHHQLMADLKRFFRPGLAHKKLMLGVTPALLQPPSRVASHSSVKENHSHAALPGFDSAAVPLQSNLARPGKDDHHGLPGLSNNHLHSPPPALLLQVQPPALNGDMFLVDLLLVQKYGKLGKILGSGAGGLVRLLTRESDNKTFAVKEFRARRSNEPLKEYAKKCTAEFCIGLTLHHPNVISTLDIMNEGDRYFEVMEYCPVDFFAVVMLGRMLRGEINCCMLQILRGVEYLHLMGLAHRDMKLDNCVMTPDGVLKLIDFGSAVVFRYPFEDQLVRAKGIVGLDPYLAPEVLSSKSYDPQPVDIWSVAIIYCCMTLRRFPWKAPKPLDQLFALFLMPDDMPHDYVQLNEQHRLLLQQRKLKQTLERDGLLPPDTQVIYESITRRINEMEAERKKIRDQFQKEKEEAAAAEAAPAAPSSRKTVHGPYRLMRLLPHALRQIINRMLALDPEQRATLGEIMADPWVRSILCCTIENGDVVHGEGHVHVVLDENEKV